MATIKDLLNSGPDELAKLDDAALLAKCAPFLVYVELNKKAPIDEKEKEQPELLQQSGLVNLDGVGQRQRQPRSTWQQEAARLAAEHGVTIELPKDLK